MIDPYELHSWGRLYREEALAKARERHLAARARAGRKLRSGRYRTVFGRLLSRFKSGRKAGSEPVPTSQVTEAIRISGVWGERTFQ